MSPMTCLLSLRHSSYTINMWARTAELCTLPLCYTMPCFPSLANHAVKSIFWNHQASFSRIILFFFFIISSPISKFPLYLLYLIPGEGKKTLNQLVESILEVTGIPNLWEEVLLYLYSAHVFAGALGIHTPSTFGELIPSGLSASCCASGWCRIAHSMSFPKGFGIQRGKFQILYLIQSLSRYMGKAPWTYILQQKTITYDSCVPFKFLNF